VRVVILAAPLSARSGVYRSTVELVEAARGRGLDWHAQIGVRRGAAGASARDVTGVTEWVVDAHGFGVANEIRRTSAAFIAEADVVITMVPQSDLAVAGLRRPRPGRHVAWVRGLPWAAPGEQSRSRRWQLRAAAHWSLSRADAVWATTPLLRDEIRSVADARIVPAGVPPLARVHDGSTLGPLVFAGRLSAEKNAELFVALARATGHSAVVHGDGPLLEALRAIAPTALAWAGWSRAEDIWRAPGTFVCPSYREAFGRSAVEAASAGMPAVLSDRTGVAEQLINDPDLAARFILPPTALARWIEAIRSLDAEPALRRRLSDHISDNARHLSTGASLDAALSALGTPTRRNT